MAAVEDNARHNCDKKNEALKIAQLHKEEDSYGGATSKTSLTVMVKMEDGFAETTSKTGFLIPKMEEHAGMDSKTSGLIQPGYGETASKSSSDLSSKNDHQAGSKTVRLPNLRHGYGLTKPQHQVGGKDILKSKSAPGSLLASLIGLDDDFLRQEAEFARLFPNDVAAFENNSTMSAPRCINGSEPVAHKLSMPLNPTSTPGFRPNATATSTTIGTTSMATKMITISAATTAIHTDTSYISHASIVNELPSGKRQCPSELQCISQLQYSKQADNLPSSQCSPSTSASIDTSRLSHILSSQQCGSGFRFPDDSVLAVASPMSFSFNANSKNPCIQPVQVWLSSNCDLQFASSFRSEAEKSNLGSLPTSCSHVEQLCELAQGESASSVSNQVDPGLNCITISSSYGKPPSHITYNGGPEQANPTPSFSPQHPPSGTVESVTPQKAAPYARHACPPRSLTIESSNGTTFDRNKSPPSRSIVLDNITSSPGLFLQLNNAHSDTDRFVLASSSSGNSSEEGTPIYGGYPSTSPSNILKFPPQKRFRESHNKSFGKSPTQEGSPVHSEDFLADSFTLYSYDDLDAMESKSPDSVICRTRAKRGCATHPRSIAERVRRTKISERMKRLQDLVPNIDKQVNTAVMLDEVVEYIKHLQEKVQELKEQQSKCDCSFRQQQQQQQQPKINNQSKE